MTVKETNKRIKVTIPVELYEEWITEIADQPIHRASKRIERLIENDLQNIRYQKMKKDLLQRQYRG